MCHSTAVVVEDTVISSSTTNEIL